jgi:hypothetical protein
MIEELSDVPYRTFHDTTNEGSGARQEAGGNIKIFIAPVTDMAAALEWFSGGDPYPVAMNPFSFLKQAPAR